MNKVFGGIYRYSREEVERACRTEKVRVYTNAGRVWVEAGENWILVRGPRLL